MGEKVRKSFGRRIDRILGQGDVSATMQRMFIRIANSTEELDDSLRLHEALQRAFPGAKVYLLVLIDLQGGSGPVRLEGSAGDDLLFYRIPQSAAMSSSINARGQGYWEAIVFAIRLWACQAEAVSEVRSLAELKGACEAFDGGDAGSQLFGPRNLPGAPTVPLPPPVVRTSGAQPMQVAPLPSVPHLMSQLPPAPAEKHGRL